MIEILTHIRGASFTAGIVLFDDKSVETVPRVRYMRGWSRNRVRSPSAQSQIRQRTVAFLFAGKAQHSNSTWASEVHDNRLCSVLFDALLPVTMLLAGTMRTG